MANIHQNHTSTTLTHANAILLDHQFGVLITGSAGSGKSTLSLALLERGHAIVADDVVQLSDEKNQLIARAPKRTHNLMSLSGVGLIFINTHFGQEALVTAMPVDLIIELHANSDKRPCLDAPQSTQTWLTQTRPKLDFHSNSYYFSPQLFEILVRKHLQYNHVYSQHNWTRHEKNINDQE